MADADRQIESLFRRVARILPPGGSLIFDTIELGEPSLAGRSWQCGDDWAVLVETQEDEGTRTLIRSIETFRRVDHLYRRGREIHKLCLFDSEALERQLAAHGFLTETARCYGRHPLLPRRRAFFCTRA